jgi:hypothetical protein
MQAAARTSVIGLLVAAMWLIGTSGASAGGATVLTDRALDKVSAGAAAVVFSADAQGAGTLVITGTNGTSFVVSSGPQYAGQPDLQATLGVADGTAVAMGNNFGQPNQPFGPASSSTNVATNGAAVGNLVIKNTYNTNITGAGGVTASAGWTFVYGGWAGI